MWPIEGLRISKERENEISNLYCMAFHKMSRVTRKSDFRLSESKGPKLRYSDSKITLLCTCSSVCVKPGRKPRRPTFSRCDS